MDFPDVVTNKLLRAQEHFEVLKVVLDGYFQEKPTVLRPDPNSSSDAVYGTFEAKIAVPYNVPLIIGDMIQNLRSSLDYLVWELVLANEKTPGRRSQFPICTNGDAFKCEIKKKRLDGVRPDAVAEIEGLQPYMARDDWKESTLWLLDEFANINKHRRILVTELRNAPLKVAPTVMIANRPFIQVDPMERDARVGPFPVVGDKVQMGHNFVSFVAFDEVPAAGMEVTQVLTYMAGHLYKEVMPKFIRFF